MEYALQDLPFAGGLGVLAGDYLMECGKQGFPLVAVGLAYGQPPGVYDFGSAKLILLESEFKQPYDNDPEIQLKKDIFLAFEGVKKLHELGFKPGIYHLNEAHAAFVNLAVRAIHESPLPKIVATKHTILSHSGFYLSQDQLKKFFPNDTERLFNLGTDAKHPDLFSTNKYLITCASRANGVSKLHVQKELETHPSSPLFPITNGINLDRWRALPPDQTDTELWQAHEQNRKAMIDYINSQTGSNLKPDVLTIVWARRLAEYKQPELIFSDEQKLLSLPVQFIMAGQPTETAPESLEIAARLTGRAKDPKFAGKFAFLPHYNLEIAKKIVAGADVWLNTPVFGREACGTSTMKAGLNGALLLTNPDGWIPEEDWNHGGGWILGDMYDIISNQIVPLFQNRPGWIAHMRLIMNLIATKYTTERMLNEYKEKLYNLH